MSKTGRMEVPQAKDAMDRFKMEVASELGIDLNNTQLTAKEAGSVGGEMVKRMIQNAKTQMK